GQSALGLQPCGPQFEAERHGHVPPAGLPLRRPLRGGRGALRADAAAGGGRDLFEEHLLRAFGDPPRGCGRGHEDGAAHAGAFPGAGRADPRGLHPELLARQLRPGPRAVGGPGLRDAGRGLGAVPRVCGDTLHVRGRPGRREEAGFPGCGEAMAPPDLHRAAGEGG
ncbi:unnamed protein product, partial [Effrenium voratum]